MMSSAIGRLRIAGVLEGISFIVLLFLAMPLKYGLGIHIAVTITGALHGGLFILYILAVLFVWIQRRWSVPRAVVAMVVSVIPFGPFIFDKSLKKEEETGISPDSAIGS
ncbi:DUF3817 domain-containing protein [Salibacterium salarium]|uniref:DUF3817 domain-containing protein n=1 Tax=Salibacterium salarium TaxID=284579 RepID=A0A428MUR2_9BACI|nr:DUF3817 domain-containing protein [Salibacterium salarium]RSL29871.1 DUF3817 domain-containing protein [Salibacterium salarium]